MSTQLTKSQLRVGKVSRKDFASLPRLPLVFVLDFGLSAHNTGAIFRLSDAIRAEKIWIINPKMTIEGKRLRRTALGTQRWVPWEFSESAVDVIKSLKDQGYKIYCIELTEKSKSYHDIKFDDKTAIVLGNEAKGVSKEVLELSDAEIHLPMHGMGNSLNVSVTAGIIGYHFLQQYGEGHKQLLQDLPRVDETSTSSPL